MIVNVSLDSSAFDETLHVLRFSAIASQVRIPAAVPDTTELSDSFEGGEDDDDDEEFEALIQEIENLQEENFKLKRDIRQHYIDMQFHELHIRETMVAENIQKCLEIEKFHQESVDHERAVMEECENRRLSILRRMMTEAHESELTDLNSEIDQLKQQLQASNSEVNQLKQQLQASSSKVNQLKQELQASNSEVDQLKRQLQASNSEVACKQQVLTEQLFSNGEEFQMLTNHVADFEDEVRDLHLLLNEKDSKLDSLLEENSQLRKSLEDANKQATDGVRELKETKMKLLEYEEKVQ
jgi:kinesin family protein 20